MNRLRHDDYLELFESAGHRIKVTLPDFDQNIREILESGKFQLNEKFSSKSEDVLAMTGSWMITQEKS